MITQVNDKNKAKYRELFDIASKLLGATKDEVLEDGTIIKVVDVKHANYIHDLYEYFVAFPAIMKAAEKEDKDNPVEGDDKYRQKYFSILPLDEPTFNVNANTRTITVPSEFKTIGVEGDHAAEIIFFLIDRFYDATDLGAPEIKATIEWRRTSGKQITEDIDQAYIKELTKYTDKVLIGWVIDKEITEEAGTIEFALRLTETDADNNVNFDFGTMPEKITVAKTLKLYPEIDEIDTEPIDTILNRINSTHTIPNIWGENTLKAPKFTKNIGDNILVSHYKDEGEYYVDLDENGEYKVEVEAESQNANGNIQYQWYYWNVNDWRTDGVLSSTNNNKTLNSVGKYRSMAIDSDGSFRTARKNSDILYILGPEVPVVKISPEGAKYYSVILKEGLEALEVKPGLKSGFISGEFNGNATTDFTYSWSYSETEDGLIQDQIDADEEGNYYPDKEGFYFGKVTALRNGQPETSKYATIYRATLPLEQPKSDNYEITVGGSVSTSGTIGNQIVISFKDYSYDLIEYIWQYSENIITTEFQDIENSRGETSNNYIEFTPDRVGHYKLIVIVSRNGEKLEAYDLFGTNDSITIKNKKD